MARGTISKPIQPTHVLKAFFWRPFIYVCSEWFEWRIYRLYQSNPHGLCIWKHCCSTDCHSCELPTSPVTPCHLPPVVDVYWIAIKWEMESKVSFYMNVASRLTNAIMTKLVSILTLLHCQHQREGALQEMGWRQGKQSGRWLETPPPPNEIRLMALSYMHCNVLRRLITSTKGQGGQLVHHQPVVCFSKRVEWGWVWDEGSLCSAMQSRAPCWLQTWVIALCLTVHWGFNR